MKLIHKPTKESAPFYNDPPKLKPTCVAETALPWMAEHIELVRVVVIRVNRKTLRRHKSKKVKDLSRLIKEVGFIIPILIDGEGNLISGEARLAAAILLDLDIVPTIRITHLTEAQIRLFRIAENRFGELSEWDEAALAEELQALIDEEIDIELTGFEVPEIDYLIQEQLPKLHATALDDLPPAPEAKNVVSRDGDLWVCGKNRVLCGDACRVDHMRRLMRGELAHALITDSPYNLQIKGVVSGKGKHQHEDFVKAAGEMSDEEFRQFQISHMKTAALYLKSGALVYSFMDHRQIGILLSAGNEVFGHHLNICVWVKTNAGMGSLYRSQHELVALFKHGTGPHRNNIQLGKFGRNRSNVWEYEGANSINPERRKELALHPTVKPARMIADIILDCTRANDIILDPFLGSGTALIAAEDTGRRAYGMELDPKYVDVILQRWEEFTGEAAILESTGQTFAEVRSQGRGPFLLPPPSEQ